jgi:hypothetical protein
MQTRFRLISWAKDNELAITLARNEFINLVELWASAHHLGYENLMEDVQGYLMFLIHWNPTFTAGLLVSKDLITRVYELSPADNPIRPLFVEEIAKIVSPEALEAAQAHLPSALLLDLALYAMRMRDKEKADKRKRASSTSTRSYSPSSASSSKSRGRRLTRSVGSSSPRSTSSR